MNLKIKFRESFRPVRAERAPRGRVSEYFEMRRSRARTCCSSRRCAGEAPPERRRPSERRVRLDKLKQLRSVVPAITHVDYSARVQTVDEDATRLRLG
jgi:carbamoyltransferase